MDVNSETRLAQVLPALADLVRQLDVNYQAAYSNDHLEAVQGLRSWADQEADWMKGRDADGNIIDQGAVVTNAPPGYSWHEFGCAVDLVPASLVGVPGWGSEDPKWQWIETNAQALGLVSGAAWHHPDKPHVQLTGRFPVTPDDEARQIWQNEGQAAFWLEVSNSISNNPPAEVSPS